jgi:hypothetical protein
LALQIAGLAGAAALVNLIVNPAMQSPIGSAIVNLRSPIQSPIGQSRHATQTGRGTNGPFI